MRIPAKKIKNIKVNKMKKELITNPRKQMSLIFCKTKEKRS